MVIGLFDLDKYWGITNGWDDFGYISDARFFANMDTFELAASSAYYSFGYALILAPFVKVIDSPVVLFRAIIVLNTTLIALSFIMALKICEVLYKNISDAIKIVISFASIIYVSNYTNSKYVFTESLVVFMFLCIAFVLIELTENYSISKLLLVSIFSVYLYFVHQRTLAVLGSVFFVIIILIINHVIPKRHSIVLFVPVAGWILGNITKSRIQAYIYHAGESQSTNIGNDYSGQLGKIDYIFSGEGIIDFVNGFLSKLFYFNVSTILIGAIGLSIIILEIVRGIKNKSSDNRMVFFIFLFLSWMGEMFIQTVFLIVPGRYDLAIYGRYIEYLYAPILTIGFMEIYKNKLSKTLLFRILLLTVISASSACFLFVKFKLAYVNSYLSPACYYLFSRIGKTKDAAIVCTGGVLFVFIIVYILNSRSSKIRISIMIFLYFIHIVINSVCIGREMVNDQAILHDNYFDMIEVIQQYDGDVWYDSTFDYMARIKQIQYLCPGVIFKKYNSGFEENNGILIAGRGAKIDHSDKLDFELLYQNYMFNIWKINN